MLNLSIKEKNLHLVEKRNILSYTVEEFEAMDPERQLETLWLQMDACLEEIKKEKQPEVSFKPSREIDLDAALQATLDWISSKTSVSKPSNHC
jgi:hypothetical protein